MGLTMAKVLQDSCHRYSITLLDRNSPLVVDDGATTATTSKTTTDPIPHPRSYALSPKSLNLIQRCLQSQDPFHPNHDDAALSLGEYHSMQI